MVNLLLFRGFGVIMKIYDELSGPDYSDNSFLYKLIEKPPLKGILQQAKRGGFSRLLEETIDRTFIVSSRKTIHKAEKMMPSLSIMEMNLDVSHSGESLYLLKRIYSRESFPYKNLIVDIGANDGLLGSNSYNFIKLGWDAVLVEPQGAELANAEINLKNYLQINSEKTQNIEFVEAAISNTDGFVELVVANDPVSMESHLLRNPNNTESQPTIKVKSMTVKTLVTEYTIPKDFGILSVDAEGNGDEVLKQWMMLGYAPAYIIFEGIHNRLPAMDIVLYLKKYQYTFIAKRGYNYILEHRPNR